MFHKMRARAAAAILCSVAMSAAVAAEGTFSLGVGVSYSSGDYGTATTTDILSIPVTGRYDTGPWSLKLTVPYIRVTGGTAAIPGIGRVNNRNPRSRGRGRGPGGTDAAEASASGLGDVVASATYAAYYNQASGVGLDLTGKIKFGTADEDEGLGTGENDYGVQADVFKSYGRFTLFGGVGYTAMGSSQFISLDDVFNVNVGGSYRLDDRDNAGLSYDWREKTSSTGSNLSEVTAFLSRRLDKSWKAQVYVLKGFSDGSPDWGVGASAAYAF